MLIVDNYLKSNLLYDLHWVEFEMCFLALASLYIHYKDKWSTQGWIFLQKQLNLYMVLNKAFEWRNGQVRIYLILNVPQD